MSGGHFSPQDSLLVRWMATTCHTHFSHQDNPSSWILLCKLGRFSCKGWLLRGSHSLLAPGYSWIDGMFHVHCTKHVWCVTAGHVQWKRCYYPWLMWQDGYQGCRNVAMAKYNHGNHAHGSAQLQQTCPVQIEPHRAHVGHIWCKKCHYSWLMGQDEYHGHRNVPMAKNDCRNHNHRSAQLW